MTSRQIFFTHVMKTGGTSLVRWLRSVVPASAAYPDAVAGGALAEKTFAHQLIGMDDAQRRAYRLISVHQPAWVAFALASDAHRVTLLREPVSRTVSHLRQLRESPHAPDAIEDIYDDEDWRRRLANHQTQLFADPGPAASGDDAKLQGDALSEADLEEIRSGVIRFWETGISHPREMGPADLDAATRALDRYDCVGVTDDLPGLVERLSRLTGLALPPAPHANAAGRSDAVSDELLARIEADNQMDLALYAHARRLSAPPFPST